MSNDFFHKQQMSWGPFTPCDMIIGGVKYRPDRERWSDLVDPVKEFGEPRKGCRDYFQERLMEFYRHYPDKPIDHYRWNCKNELCSSLQQQLHEQQTKETMSKFKKGDRVKVTRENSVNLGREGVVLRVYEDSRSYDVDLGDAGGVSFTETSLTLLDQSLSTTPDKVLEAAETSPQAKDALKALFPDVFKEEPHEFGRNQTLLTEGGTLPFVIGTSGAPDGLHNKCLIVRGTYEMRTQSHRGFTILTFDKKP